MCTIATAKVQRNYNCHNVYFYECLLITNIKKKKTTGIIETMTPVYMREKMFCG